MSRDYFSLEDAVSAVDFRNERPFRCHVHGDGKASASVNMAKQVWVCYTCGAHGHVDSDLIILDDARFGDDIEEMLREIEPISERMLDLYTSGPVHPYWLSRFQESTCRHFQLGYDPAREKVCYPMRFSDGTLAGIVRRNDNPEDGGKYRYPFGFTKSDFIFNYSPEHRSHIILHEGAMDVCSSWEAGYDAFGIYGARLSTAQQVLIDKVDPDLVVCCFDNDLAGRNATAQVQGVYQYRQVIEFDWSRYPDKKDVGELSTKQLERALDRLVS